MEIRRQGAKYVVVLHQEVPLHNVRPATDYLMHSMAQYAGTKPVGVMLTGMRKDGAQGPLKMKKAGSINYAQDEKSCVEFGMPGAAVNIGTVDKVLPLDRIVGDILTHLKKSNAAMYDGT